MGSFLRKGFDIGPIAKKRKVSGEPMFSLHQCSLSMEEESFIVPKPEAYGI